MDLHAALTFMTTSARVLDRRRLEVRLDRGEPAGVLLALDAYRNPDGGYGWGLEPDLRSTSSQPVGAMHALEAFADVAGASSTAPERLCDWLLAHSLPDGGMPFCLPFSDTDGCAPHWTGADPTASSLQMTAQLAAQGHRLARHRTEIADHPWLAAATDYCLTRLESSEDEPSAYELMFVLWFLDAAAGRVPRAATLLDRYAALVGPGAPVAVPGGAEGEVLHLLDLAPYADGPLRARLPGDAVAADLERLDRGQQSDGGWTVDFAAFSPAAGLEWRGYATLGAVQVLTGARR